MHYTAMSAMQFHAASRTTSALAPALDGPLFSGRSASVFVVTASLLILVGAIVSARIDQTVRRQLRETQRTLEHRVAEHEAEAAKATELYRLLAETRDRHGVDASVLTDASTTPHQPGPNFIGISVDRDQRPTPR